MEVPRLFYILKPRDMLIVIKTFAEHFTFIGSVQRYYMYCLLSALTAL